jgi:hypothetical protein
MLPILLLGLAIRCADADVCPSDAEIIAAVDAYSVEEWAVTDGLDPNVVMEPPGLIRRISRVRCGPAGGDPLRVNCSFTMRYHRWNRSNEIVTLEWRRSRWRVVEQLSVRLANPDPD